MPAATTVAQLAVVVSADTTQAERGLADLGQKVGSAGSALQSAFSTAAVAGIAGVAAGLAASVTAATDFEKTMSGVKAVSGATAEEMAAVTSTALDLGAKTAFSASEAGKGIEELVKGGLTIGEAMTAAKATLDLAAAGGISVADSATIAANALAQFSLPAEKMAHVSDLIAGAANASALDVSQFKFSLQAAGAVAATVGFSFDDLAQGIAVMGKAGITGSDAGTSLKTMMLNLVPSTKKASELMRDLGIITADGANQFFDATGKVRSMADVAQVLQTALEGQTEAQKISTLNTLFGSDAIRAAAVLAKEGASGFNDMAAAMGKVSAESVGAEKLNNLAGSVEQLKGSLETMAITVGIELLPVLKDFVDALTQAANDAMPAMQQAAKDLAATLAAWAPTLKAVAGFLWEHRDAVLAVVAALATFTILTTVIGWVTAIATAISTVTAVISASGGIMAALGALVAILGGPVTLIIAAVAIAVGALAYAWAENWGDIQGKTAAVVDFLSGVPDTVSGFFTDIGHAAEGLQLAVEAAWDAIKTSTETVWNGIADFLTTWWREILIALTGPVGAVAVLVIDNWGAIKTGTETAWNGVTGIVAVLAGAWDAITTVTSDAFSTATTGIVAVVSAGWALVKTGIDTVFGAGTGDTITGIVQAGWTAVAGATRSLISGDTESALAYAKAGWDLVKTGIDAIFGAGTGDTISGVVTAGWTAVATLTKALLSGEAAESLKSVVSSGWDGIVSLLKNLVQAGSDFLGAAKAVGIGMITSVQDGIRDTLGSFWEWLKTNFTDKIPSYVKELLGIHSPSSVMYDIGVQLVEGLRVGMESRLPSIDELVSRVIGQVGAMSGDVDDWLKAAIAYTKAPSSWLEPLKWIVAHESSGDPTAKNPNSTAAGLFQIIDSTWAASRDKALPNDIFSPVINAIGGIRYIEGRYGNPFEAVNFWKEHGHYATGGWAGLHGPELAWLGERGPEYVVSNAAVRAGAGSGGDTYYIDARGAQVYDGSKFEDLLIGALERAGRRGRITPITGGPGGR